MYVVTVLNVVLLCSAQPTQSFLVPKLAETKSD